MDVSQVAALLEDFLRPLAGGAELAGKWSQKLDDLSNVVVVLAVLGAGLGVEEVVPGDQLKDLDGNALNDHGHS